MDYRTIHINVFEDYLPDLHLTSADVAEHLPAQSIFNVLDAIPMPLGSPYNVYAAGIENVVAGMDLEAMTFILKFSQTPESLARLEHEAGLYAHQLLPLQGTVVPNCYGFFKGNFGTQEIGCLILEYIDSSPSPDDEEITDERENAQELLYRVSMIHAAGVTLNHPGGNLHTVGPDYDLKIIDFTAASVHVCGGVHPVLDSAPDEVHDGDVEACLELTLIEQKISQLSRFCALHEEALEEQSKLMAPRRSSVWSSWST